MTLSSSSKQFGLILNTAKTFKYKKFLVLKYSCDVDSGFLGFIISRKFGSSVVRNQLKRFCREDFRRIFNNIAVGVVVRPINKKIDRNCVTNSFLELKKIIL